MAKPLTHEEIIAGATAITELGTAHIYFLIESGAVAYVGQSTSVYARLQAHKNDPNKTWDSYYLLRVPTEQLDELELYYYNLLKPKLNRTPPTPAGREWRKTQNRLAPLSDEEEEALALAIQLETSKTLDSLLGIPRRRRRL